jgi:uncharacterized protein YcnI
MKRLALLTLAGLVALLALAVPAFAHVTVTAPGATRGGSDQEITFRVPVEKNVATTGLTIALPLNTPLASVLVDPMPGWTHQQKSTKVAKPITTDDGQITEAVSEISWRAQSGQGLAPGEFGSFTILAGLLPNAPSLTFKALQYYADGSVVKWIETAAPGSNAQPVDPAPVLQLPATAQAAATVSPAPSSSGSSSSSGKSSSNAGPTALSIVALVLAAAALGFTVVSRATSRAGRRG